MALGHAISALPRLSRLQWLVALLLVVMTTATAFAFGIGPLATAESTGETTFYHGAVRQRLPVGWRAIYNAQQPWRQATLLNSQGYPTFEVAIEILPVNHLAPGVDPIDSYMGPIVERWRRWGGAPSVERRALNGRPLAFFGATYPQQPSPYALPLRYQLLGLGGLSPAEAGQRLMVTSFIFCEQVDRQLIVYSFQTDRQPINEFRQLAWALIQSTEWRLM
jgi:hypothetical protein